MKALALAIALAATPAVAFAQAPGGPPYGFFPRGMPNIGDLWIEFCNAQGEHCSREEAKIWGQVCDSETANVVVNGPKDNASHVTPLDGLHYAGWRCGEQGNLIRPNQNGFYNDGKFVPVAKSLRAATAPTISGTTFAISSCTLGLDCPGDTPRTSTLYTQTYGGRIGIEHGLTKDECEVRRKQALGEPATDEEKAAAKMFADEAQAKGPKIQAVSGLAFPASMRTTSDILHAECRDKPLESKR